MKKELTVKQQLFCKEYLIDFNATQSAIRAGYSEKTAYSIGIENLNKPEIQTAIKVEIDKKFKGIDDLSQKIIDELIKVAFSDIKDYLSFNENGVSFHNSSEVDGTVISEILSTETKQGSNGKQETIRANLKLKLHDKLKALELLGRYKTLFTDKTVNVGMTFEDFLKSMDDK